MPASRPTAAPVVSFALGAVALLVVVATVLTATVGGGRSEVATSGGRITLDIPSGIDPDQSSAAPAAPSTTPATAPTTTTAGTSRTANSTGAAAGPATTVPPLAGPPGATRTTILPTTTAPDPGPATGGVYGQVVTSSGTPLPGVCVTTDHQQAPVIAHTADDGTFAIDHVLTGRTRVLLVDGPAGCMTLEGSTVAVDPVDVADGAWVPVRVTVTLPPVEVPVVG